MTVVALVHVCDEDVAPCGSHKVPRVRDGDPHSLHQPRLSPGHRGERRSSPHLPSFGAPAGLRNQGRASSPESAECQEVMVGPDNTSLHLGASDRSAKSDTFCFASKARCASSRCAVMSAV